MIAAKLRALPFVALLFPLDLVVAGFILIADLLSLPLRLFRSGRSLRSADSAPVDASSVTIQILNWNGLHLLRECLPGVMAAA